MTPATVAGDPAPADLGILRWRRRETLRLALAELVRIPSVCDDGGHGLPCGRGVDGTLRPAPRSSAGWGSRVNCGDGCFYGHPDVCEGDEPVGVPGPVDVASGAAPGKGKARTRDMSCSQASYAWVRTIRTDSPVHVSRASSRWSLGSRTMRTGRLVSAPERKDDVR